MGIHVYEPLHAYMETGLISGVRRRAEAAIPDWGERPVAVDRRLAMAG